MELDLDFDMAADILTVSVLLSLTLVQWRTIYPKDYTIARSLKEVLCLFFNKLHLI